MVPEQAEPNAALLLSFILNANLEQIIYMLFMYVYASVKRLNWNNEQWQTV